MERIFTLLQKIEASKTEVYDLIAKSLRKIAKDCPNCSNSGALYNTQAGRYEWIAEQCEWCYTEKLSRFHVNEKLAEIKELLR